MKMTPLDIRQKRFESELRGYSKKEVEGFLELTAGEFEEVVRENIALKDELKRTQAQLEHAPRAREDAAGDDGHRAAHLRGREGPGARRRPSCASPTPSCRRRRSSPAPTTGWCELVKRHERAQAPEGAVRVAARDRSSPRTRSCSRPSDRHARGRRRGLPDEEDRRAPVSWLKDAPGGVELLGAGAAARLAHQGGRRARRAAEDRPRRAAGGR